jgi:twitching motility protein PilI
VNASKPTDTMSEDPEDTPQAGRLRDFSNQLEARLKAAPRLPSEPTRLAVRIGSNAYLVDMALAGEIVPLGAVTPVPWTRSWFRGLTNVRGRLVGVLDLLELEGRSPLPPDQAFQLLVMGEALKVNAAILITRAFGIRNLKDLDAVGASGAGATRWERERYRDLDGTTLAELDLRELVASDVFGTIGV